LLANHKGEVPFLVLLLPFLLGISVGVNFSYASFLIWVITPLLLLTITFVTLNLNFAYLNLYRFRWLGGLFINLILFLTGWLSVILFSDLNRESHFSKQVARHFIIKVNSEPVIKNGLIRFTAKVEQTADELPRITSGTLLISIKDSLALKIGYGDRLLIPSTFKAVDPPFNPAEFNYKRYLAHQNIYHQAFLYPGHYRVLDHNSGNPLIAYSLKVRQRMVDKLKRNMRDTAAIAVASTLILGYKADLSSDLLQAYSKTGTLHILSVSGGHVAIIYLILNFLLGFFCRSNRGRLVKALLILLLIWCYALLTGLSPAVCRAALMISLVIFGTTYSRYINTLNILAVSAYFLLLHNPLLITDVGFQLSYLAVAGMVVLQPLIYTWLKVNSKWVDKLWAACSVSIAAQIITFPLSSYYFHQFPVYFLISNLFIIIPAQIILSVGMIYLILPDVAYISTGLAWVLEKSILLMNKVLVVIEHLPFGSIDKIWFNTSEYIFLYFGIMCLFYSLTAKKSWMLNVALLSILILSLSITLKDTRQLAVSTVTFLNLRKHQGIVLRQGDKARILTDLDPSSKNYQYSVQPYLDSCKVIDTAVYTLEKNITSKFLMKYKNLIQFQAKKILIIDSNMEHRRFPQKLNVDYLYLTNNSDVTVNKLNENYIYSRLIIDGSNSDKRIADVVQQAQALGVNYQIIKRNNALVIPSK
jgi:competence protein ComEC